MLAEIRNISQDQTISENKDHVQAVLALHTKGRKKEIEYHETTPRLFE